MIVFQARPFDQTGTDIAGFLEAVNAGIADEYQALLEQILLQAEQDAPLGVDIPSSGHRAGTLRRAGFIEGPRKVSRGELAFYIGFGGEASDYSWVQHEDLSFSHPRGGGAKYLEKNLAASNQFFIDAGARATRLAAQRHLPGDLT